MTDLQVALSERDKVIHELTDSLKQSIQIRDRLHDQSEKLQNEVQQLRAAPSGSRTKWPSVNENRLSQTTIDLVSESEDEVEKQAKRPAIDDFEKRLSADEQKLFESTREKFNEFLKHELQSISETLAHETQEKNDKDAEMNRLRHLLANVKGGSAEVQQLRQELDTIHKKEMEDLRMYFEQKCSDLEKQ